MGSFINNVTPISLCDVIYELPLCVNASTHVQIRFEEIIFTSHISHQPKFTVTRFLDFITFFKKKNFLITAFVVTIFSTDFLLFLNLPTRGGCCLILLVLHKSVHLFNLIDLKEVYPPASEASKEGSKFN